MEIIQVFSLTAFLLGSAIISIILLLFKGPGDRLITFSLFSFSYFVFLVFLLTTRYILLIPFIFGTGVILSYMCFRLLSPGKVLSASYKQILTGITLRTFQPYHAK